MNRVSFHRACLLAAVLAAPMLVAIGCGPKNFRNDNDELRRERTVLSDRVEVLESEIAELRIKLAEERRTREGLIGQEPLSALPRVTSVSLGRLTGFSRDGDLSVYVTPRDGRGRFVQIVGTLRVRATHVPEAGSERTPTVMVEDVLPPLAVRDSYRSGLGGLAYVVDLGTPSIAGIDSGSILIEATLEDAVTGEQHTATQTLILPEAIAILRPAD